MELKENTKTEILFFFFFLTFFSLLPDHVCRNQREIIGETVSHSNPKCQKLKSFSIILDISTFKVTHVYFSGACSCAEHLG